MSKVTESIKAAINGEYIADASVGATFTNGASQAVYVAAEATRLDFTMPGGQVRFDNVPAGTILPIQATAVVASVSSAVAITVLHNN